jgi:hypothetical protein
MRVLIPYDEGFEYEKVKSMYDENRLRLREQSTFDEVLKNTLFYSFYDGERITLCVYYYSLEGKLWVNGFGKRNSHLFNKKCFEISLKWFDCDVWIDTPYREVAWAVCQCGFKRVEKGIYRYVQQ